MTTKAWYRRKARVVPLGALALGVVAALVWTLSPWPASLLIRAMFESNARDTVKEMLPYVPDVALNQHLNVQYGPSGIDTSLDVFTPAGTAGPLATVVWIHGGAWISGNKESVRPYVQTLATHGYTTVALNYTVGPEATYPTALMQLNEALAFLVTHADEYNIDPDRIIIAGDSAGANLTSQLATLVTSESYASLVGVEPALTADQLRAVILNCGIYDVSEIPNAPGIGGWGFRVALWAYLGEKDWSNTPAGDEMSTIDYVTGDFPETWISGGNADPLTPGQSAKLAAKLQGLGVAVTPVFYAADHTPALPHEYQFHLDLADAQAALADTVAFLDRVTG